MSLMSCDGTAGRKVHRRGYSPYTYGGHRDEPLQQDSDGNISGVEYLEGLSGTESAGEWQDDRHLKSGSTVGGISKKPKRMKKCTELRRASETNAGKRSTDLKLEGRQTAADDPDMTCSQIGPEFGQQPAGEFLLVSDSDAQDSASDISNLDLSATASDSVKRAPWHNSASIGDQSRQATRDSHAIQDRGRRFRKAQVWQPDDGQHSLKTSPGSMRIEQTGTFPADATVVEGEGGLIMFPKIE